MQDLQEKLIDDVENGAADVVAVLKIIPPPKNCKECLCHVMTSEIGTSATGGKLFDCKVFSCAGHKGRGTLNPEFDFLNNYDDYSKGVAPNCPLEKYHEI